jgi:RNA polymerase sigma-70 factor (ECF subfamily)
MAAAAKVATPVSGDFEGIVREHQSMVFSIAYHFLHDRPAAEELSQDVFLQLYKGMGALESAEHVKRWLRRVTTNRCIDQCRRSKLMPRIGLDQVAEPAIPAGLPDLMLSRALGQLVASLPGNWRALVILKYQEEMETEEIARALNMPVGTVKSQLSRALDFLREKASRVLGESE